MSRKVAVVGGGISGLAAAEAIQNQSEAQGVAVDVRVFEAEDQPGGKVRSERNQDFVVEWGPHGYLDKEPAMKDLVARLNLQDERIEADAASAHRFIVQQGILQELPSKPPAFLKSDILPFSAKLRVLYEPFVNRFEGDEESVTDFFSRRLGPKVSERLVDAMVTGIYGGDPKRLSVQAAFPRLAALEQEHGSLILGSIKERRAARKQLPAKTGLVPTMCSFKNGMGTLTTALADRLQIEASHPAKALETQAEGGYRVVFDNETYDADAVVLAVPAPVASTLIAPLRPALAPELSNVEYAPVSVVVLAFPVSAVTGSLTGFGFLAPHPEGRDLLGCIWATSVFPAHGPEGSVMFRVLVGGRRRPDLAAMDDDGLIASVRRELGALIGLSPDVTPTMSRILRWPSGIPHYEMQHNLRVAAADRVTEELPGVFVVGNGYRGVALLDCVRTGQKLAPQVLRHLESV